MDQHELAAKQFGATAEQYLSSAVHAAGADLERITARVTASAPVRVLDLGCGAGHASYAAARGEAAEVVAYDLASPMLALVDSQARARGHEQVRTVRGSADSLPFADAAFGMVVTRYSAHHWLDVRRALGEAARVLTPGGTLIVIDVLAPENALLDTVLQTVELLRDLSHVRDYRESEWLTLLGASGFSTQNTERWKLHMEFAGWIDRIGTPPQRAAAIKVVLDALPGEARSYFDVAGDHSFVIDADWVEAIKTAG